jgi:hypothetical protein
LDTPSVWHDLSAGLSSSEAGKKPVKVDVVAKNGEDDTPLYMAVGTPTATHTHTHTHTHLYIYVHIRIYIYIYII